MPAPAGMYRIDTGRKDNTEARNMASRMPTRWSDGTMIMHSTLAAIEEPESELSYFEYQDPRCGLQRMSTGKAKRALSVTDF